MEMEADAMEMETETGKIKISEVVFDPKFQTSTKLTDFSQVKMCMD